MSHKFKIPLQTEVFLYIKEKKGWPEKFCTYYAEKFWNNYQASGWKLSNGNAVKDWKACFNSQWQNLKYKEDIEFLNSLIGKNGIIQSNGTKAPVNDFERLDRFMSEYFKRPADAKFESFGAWYEFMKENKLLKVFTRGEVFQLREIYGQDNQKCRCAAVQMSLDAYRNTGLKIMDLIKMRESLDSR